MGMFDDIRCKYPLPVAGANELAYQTKDTDAQYLDQYEIREDGTLWHEIYDIEDQSEVGKWIDKNPGKEIPASFGLEGWLGCMTRVNKRWEQVKLTGEIAFYTTLGEDYSGWLEFSAYFENGIVTRMNLIEHKLANNGRHIGNLRKEFIKANIR